MEFCGGQIWNGGGNWAVVFQFVSTHFYVRYVCLFLLVSDVKYDTAWGCLAVLGDTSLMDEIYVSVPSVSLIPWKSRPIFLATPLEHFGFSSPFGRCMYSWNFYVSGKMLSLVFPVWMMTYPVMNFLMNQLSPVCLIFMVEGAEVGIFLEV